MAKVIAYEISVGGVKTAITNQEDLAAAVRETTKIFKSADFGSKSYQDAEKELAQLRTLQAKFRQDVRDTAREQEIAADKGKGSYRALNAELVNLRRRYKELSAAERDTVGPDLLNRIQKLDTELKEIDASMGQYQRNVGNYASAFAELGGLDLASLATVPGAIIAVGSAAIDATRYLFEMTEEFRILRGEIQTLTDATGPELDEFTARISAIGETFDESATDILNAANAVSKGLDISFREALDRIEEGFIAGSNQTGEFLDNLREYPTFFKEAELGADALFKVINQQAKEGIFSDKGPDVIKEATERLGELPKATQEAIGLIGLRVEDIRKLIEEKGIGAAIAAVSEQLNDFEADSVEYRQAVANIFGSPGIDAGEGFIKSLKTINEATGDLIDLNNEYQVQQAKTLEINREFAEVQNEVAKELGGVGVGFDNLGTVIETKALQVLLFVVERFKELLGIFSPLVNAFRPLLESLGLFNTEASTAENIASLLAKGFRLVITPLELVVQFIAKSVEGLTDFVKAGRGVLEWIGLVDKKAPEASSKMDDMAGAMDDLADSTKNVTKEQKEQNKEADTTIRKYKDLKKSTDEAATAADKYAKGSIAQLRAEVSKLKKELDETAPENAQGVLERLIGAEEALEKVEQARTEIRNRLTSARRDIPPLEILPSEARTREVVSENTQVVLDEYKKRNEAIVEQEEKLAVDLKEIQRDLFSGISDVLSNLGEASQLRYENEERALEERYEREIALAGNNTARQRQLENQLESERSRLRARALEEQKKYRTIAAEASFFEGVVNILSSPTTIPDPFGALYKAGRIALLRVTTDQQIANINAQTGEKGLLVEQMARGGMLYGATHQDRSGGIPLAIHGRPVIAEHGEAWDTDEYGGVAIINKRSTAAYRRQLEQVRGRIFPGKRRYLSDINSARSYGVPFAAEGALFTPEVASVISGRSGGSSSAGAGPIAIDGNSINLIATATAAAVYRGAREGTAAGSGDVTKRRVREARLSQRTGI